MKLFKIAALLLVPFFSLAVQAQDNTLYKPITPPQPTSADEGMVEVIEIFSYGCSHCFRFEPMLERWVKNKPDNVKFVQMPAIFNDTLAMYARAFYVAEALDVLDKVHMPMFEAIHMQKRRMSSEAEIASLFAEHGVDQATFEKTFRSFAVEAKVRRAAELGKRYGLQATPSMVVNGKYITDPGMTNGFQGMINLIDTLVKKES